MTEEICRWGPFTGVGDYNLKHNDWNGDPALRLVCCKLYDRGYPFWTFASPDGYGIQEPFLWLGTGFTSLGFNRGTPRPCTLEVGMPLSSAPFVQFVAFANVIQTVTDRLARPTYITAGSHAPGKLIVRVLSEWIGNTRAKSETVIDVPLNDGNPLNLWFVDFAGSLPWDDGKDHWVDELHIDVISDPAWTRLGLPPIRLEIPEIILVPKGIPCGIRTPISNNIGYNPNPCPGGGGGGGGLPSSSAIIASVLNLIKGVPANLMCAKPLCEQYGCVNCPYGCECDHSPPKKCDSL